MEEAARIRRSVYPMTPELTEWLHHSGLQPIEESIFHYYRRILPLQDLVQAAEAGKRPKYVALAAIREYNDAGAAQAAEENRVFTPCTYEDLVQGNTSFIFSDFGEWAAYTDNPASIILGGWDEPEQAFTHADSDVEWLVVWLTREEYLVVYRSPYVAYKRPVAAIEGEDVFPNDNLFAEGLSKGRLAAFALPPEIEASLGWLTADEVFKPYETRV